MKRTAVLIFIITFLFTLNIIFAQEEYVYDSQWTHELFDIPYGIGINSYDNVYVPGTNSNCVLIFTSDGVLVDIWGGTRGSAPGEFDVPISVAFDSYNNVYVYDWGNVRIQKFTSDGTFILEWGEYGSGDGQFKWGWGSIAVDGSDNVYLVDGSNNRIQKFTSEGVFLTKWGNSGSGPSQFDWPTGITIDSNNNVYVVDYGNSRVQKFSSDGNFLLEWGEYGSGDGQFSWPWGGISVDSYDDVFVVDPENHRVQKFTTDGLFITKWGSQGTGDGQFIYPGDVAINSAGYVYVVDGDNDRVQKFAPPAPALSLIQGVVSVNNNGLNGVIVKLLDEFGIPVDGYDDQYTDANGEYSFTDVSVGDYQVMIVEPLGYIVDQNPKLTTVLAIETSIVNFDLTEIVVVNAARSKGYWKHQFDVYVKGRGNAQEAEQDLYDYIDLVHQHYTLHYNIYTDVTTFEEWQDILSLKGNHPMVERARQHLSAAVMNMVSNKVGQYTAVTADGRDVGDVIQYVSELILDGDETNDELAKDLAESVNNQQTIAAGIVPDGNIIFKQGTELGEVITYELSSNYPNPFNPSTTIKYQIADAGWVILNVYDVLGNEVVTLVNERKEEGIYEVMFDATSLSSGIYIYKMSVNDFVSTQKMILMK